MEKIIKEELRSGEKLLWFSKAEEFETMDKTYKNYLLRRTALIIGIVAALCIVYVVYSGAKGIELKPALIVISMACAFLGAANGFLDAKKLHRIVYAITDQRIISILELPKSLEYDKIDAAEFKTDDDGHTSLLIGGKTINSKAHYWRNLALADPYIDEDSGMCTRFVLYAVPEAEKVKKILAEYISL